MTYLFSDLLSGRTSRHMTEKQWDSLVEKMLNSGINILLSINKHNFYENITCMNIYVLP